MPIRKRATPAATAGEQRRYGRKISPVSTPPAHLDPTQGFAMTGAAFKRAVKAEYTISTAQLPTLELAADSLDRANAAAACVRELGVLVESPQGIKANPAELVLSRAEASFQRACKLLGVYGVEVKADADDAPDWARAS